MNQPIIEHDPDEPPPDRTGNGVFWVNLGLLAALWVWFVLTGEPDRWIGVALGFWTGMFLAIWALHITGNKVPKWMR